MPEIERFHFELDRLLAEKRELLTKVLIKGTVRCQVKVLEELKRRVERVLLEPLVPFGGVLSREKLEKGFAENVRRMMGKDEDSDAPVRCGFCGTKAPSRWRPGSSYRCGRCPPLGAGER